MPNKYGTLMGSLLEAIGEATGFFEWPPPQTVAWAWKQHRNKRALRNAVYNLKRKGLLKIVNKQGKKFLELTAKGEIEKLMSLASIERPAKWDGQWRIMIFDIPESSREKRNLLRSLLKRNGFYKLQASVFISPYPLNKEAIAYLRETRLYEFIRIIRANAIDDDKDLRKKFSLI